jgi:hypothetical protein
MMMRDTEEDDVRDQTSMTIQTINNINDTEVQQDLKTILRKWINECVNIHKPFHKKESTMVIDSGATSSFVRPEENLPVTGLSSKIVHLPDGSSIRGNPHHFVAFQVAIAKSKNSGCITRLTTKLFG